MKRWNCILKFVFVAVLVLMMSGCGSSLMMRVKPADAPMGSDALVTFFRPSVFGGAIKFGLWDNENFLGILTAGSYIQYRTHAGEHLFISQAENWSYVKADLEAGKEYYVIGKVFPGVWKARCALDPINIEDNVSQEKIDGWKNKLKPTAVIKEKVDAYKNQRLRNIKRAIEDFEAGKVKFATIKPADGR